MNARMFNSFLDGTKSAIEMAAVANATGLRPAAGWAALPAMRERRAGRDAQAGRRRRNAPERGDSVEVVSSLQRDGSPVERDLRWGVYVTFAAPSDYAARCFGEYGVATDRSGRYAALYRPDAPDRAGARHQRRLRGAAGRADRRAGTVRRRRRGGRQARPPRRRGAGRGGRLDRLGPADTGCRLPGSGCPADRPDGRGGAHPRRSRPERQSRAPTWSCRFPPTFWNSDGRWSVERCLNHVDHKAPDGERRVRPIGSRRTLIRLESKTTSAPAVRSASTALRLATRCRTSSRRCDPACDGRESPRALPIPSWRAACRSQCPPRSEFDPRAPRVRRVRDRQRTAAGVRARAEHHGLLRRGRRRSAATAHCRRGISSTGEQRQLALVDRGCRVRERLADILDFEIRILLNDPSFRFIPCATRPTTVVTGMRSPRMHGTPPICAGSTVIRSSRMQVRYHGSRSQQPSAPHCLPERGC